jgi:hypothetical protein
MAASAERPSPRWRTRLAWLAVFWVGGVAAMGMATVLLRWSMRLAGLGS